MRGKTKWVLVAGVALFMLSMAAVYASAADKEPHRSDTTAPSQEDGIGIEDGSLTMPRLLSRPPQAYPPEALNRMEQGTVVVLAVLDETGHVTEASVKRTSGFASLDESALREVRKWLFAPAKREGKPISSSILLSVVYRLE